MKEHSPSPPITEEQQPLESKASPELVSALRRLLRPLVRFLISKQVSYPYLANLLKGIFIDVARHDIPSQGLRLTDSRLSVMTGVHRKDVKRLIEASEAPLTVPTHISLGAKLMARWNADPAYLDTQARPMALPRLAQPNDAPSFDRLVLEESKDIRARAVLDEWIRLGLVTVDERDYVCLSSGAFVAEGEAEKLYYFGRNLRDHIDTAVHNVLNEGKPRIERSVYAGGLTQESLAVLSEMAETMGMDMLRALNAKARELKQAQTEEGEHRMTLGVYFYREGDRDGK